jgi:GxxExxY protein
LELNEISKLIIGCAIEVHKSLGPGLLESAYEECLYYEIKKLGLKVDRQKPLPIIYKEIKLECGYRMDLVIEDSVIAELKSVDTIIDIHHAQILTYMRFANIKLGLLINFNVMKLVDGVKRFVL